MQTNSSDYRFKSLSGFTLVEVLVSVALISTMAVYFIQAQIQQVQDRVIEALAQDVLTLANASMSYYSQISRWPAQEVDDCASLVQDLAAMGAFPVGLNGYEGMDGVALQTTCADVDDIGRTLRISVVFPVGDQDSAAMLRSYLPTSAMPIVAADQPPVVVHYVATPRKASQRYNFERVVVGAGGLFTLPKPDCPGNRNDPAHILLPQSICIHNAEHGLGGFLFNDESNNRDDFWTLRLMVADGDDNERINDFAGVSSCGGNPIEVGAITYCETN
ncbi:MAG: type II secretion system protein [Ketobacter sp.]|nr:type II secretion system protein [Ketobacter sp.]